MSAQIAHLIVPYAIVKCRRDPTAAKHRVKTYCKFDAFRPKRNPARRRADGPLQPVKLNRLRPTADRTISDCRRHPPERYEPYLERGRGEFDQCLGEERCAPVAKAGETPSGNLGYLVHGVSM